MLKHLSIKTKLYLGFGAILAIILLLLTIAYNRFNSLSDANALDRHTMVVIQAIDSLRNDLLQVQVEARGYYLTGAPVRIERTRKELRDIPASVRRLQALVRGNPQQMEGFKKLESMIEVWAKDVIESQLAMREQMGDKPGAADAMGRSPQQTGGNAAIGAIYKFMNEASSEEKRLLAERTAASESLQASMRRRCARSAAAFLPLRRRS